MRTDKRQQIGGERGDLLVAGIRGNAMGDTVKGKANAIIGISILIVVFVAIGAIATPGLSSYGGITDRFYAAVAFWVVLLLVLALFGYLANALGREVDGIYEKGISSGRTTLVESRRGQGFVPYESITSITLENRDTPEGVLKVLTICSGEPEAPALRPFADYGYKNDFWNRLKQTLQVHCPNARWIDEGRPSK